MSEKIEDITDSPFAAPVEAPDSLPTRRPSREIEAEP